MVSSPFSFSVWARTIDKLLEPSQVLIYRTIVLFLLSMVGDKGTAEPMVWFILSLVSVLMR